MKTLSPAKPVAGNRRFNFLPGMFGRKPADFIGGENLIFAYARAFLPDYTGGSWTFYTAENHAHFAAPEGEREWAVSVANKGYKGTVSTEAAGIIVSMYALNTMMVRAHARGDDPATDFLADRYYELRAYALLHPEQQAIFAAID